MSLKFSRRAAARRLPESSRSVPEPRQSVPERIRWRMGLPCRPQSSSLGPEGILFGEDCPAKGE